MQRIKKIKGRRIVLFGVSVFFLLAGACQTLSSPSRDRIDLAGAWQMTCDSLSSATVSLPGTLDTNGEGIPNTSRNETSHLSRERTYEGPVCYTRKITIPARWEGRAIDLFMERTKPTRIWVDNQEVGANTYISVPQRYDLSQWLTPGTHTLTIEVDNSEAAVPPQILSNSHAYTASTQTNWNGILGDFFLEAAPDCRLDDVQVLTQAAARIVTVKLTVTNAQTTVSEMPVRLRVREEGATHKIVCDTVCPLTVKPIVGNVSKGTYTVTLPLDPTTPLWDEFNPHLLTLLVELENGDAQQVTFGLCDFTTRGTQFVVNDRTTFLRGKHDACVFPLTAHTAMDVATWQHYFQVAKSYGINHYRFHSWCPPEACFTAADREGIYLQPELPFWGSLDSTDHRLVDFLLAEGEAIQRAYGNHPSFVAFALGNELSGDRAVMQRLLAHFRAVDNRHLYAFGSNNYLGYEGYVAGEDFMTTARVGGEAWGTYTTHTRASFSFADAYDGGLMNHTYPNTLIDFSQAAGRCPVPVISHEVGQYQMYPNYDQIAKYTGVLKPWNLEIFRHRLEEAGMGEKADAFFQASGRWAVELYKAEIEMDLRTPGFGGFQLLDLQDYPGQGSAYVGVLDAFMDSKRLVEPLVWRGFCAPVVPLLETGKRVWTTDEPFQGRVVVANYGPDALTSHVKWSLTAVGTEGIAADSCLASGRLNAQAPQGAVSPVGDLTIGLTHVTRPIQAVLHLALEGSDTENRYTLWIYPASSHEPVTASKTYVTHRMDEAALRLLQEGGRVLLFPPKASLADTMIVGPLMQTDYWNYKMFKGICEWVKKPVSPGTLGLLIDADHPVFHTFPTLFHTDWQWFPIVKNSYPLRKECLPAVLGFTPDETQIIVQAIDNVERNYELGLLFSCRVGVGTLLVCMSNLTTQGNYVESRQFLQSLVTSGDK